MIIAFWISLLIIFYTFLGYGMLLYCMVRIRRYLKGRRIIPEFKAASLPSCTLVITAYNEEDIIREKIANTLALKYPDGKLDIFFVTDGSTDQSPAILAACPGIKLLHIPERKGKIRAMDRAVGQVNSDIIIFTDANTILNKNALLNIARHYADGKIGAVAGEKRIYTDNMDDAGAAGEGFYWRYESALKKWDSELYSVVGAAGELFSIRRMLYQAVPDDTILDDFMISMLIAKKGYRIVYEPEAYAIENASENVTEELKRKIRIAAGGIQSIMRLKPLLNIFRYGLLSFQYISHRVLRWTLTPLLLIMVFILNALIISSANELLYFILFAGQFCFYLLALMGLIYEKKQVRIKILFIPFYFCIMNYAVLIGMKRYLTKGQSPIWEKAKRKHTRGSNF